MVAQEFTICIFQVLCLLLLISGNGNCETQEQLDTHLRTHDLTRSTGQTLQSKAVNDFVVVNKTSEMYNYEYDGNTELARTFGTHRRRMQFALLPIMYKMGVITTLLFGLVILTLKGLTIGVILLIFAFGNYFAKFKGGHHTAHAQPIHVHVHPDQHAKYPTYSSHSSFGSGPYDRNDDVNNNLYQDDPDPRYLRRWPKGYQTARRLKKAQRPQIGQHLINI